ncbi:MAG: phosphate regulon sensor histidine kinase PhoR [Pseudohongiella sp.]|nr:phosphate regulon sensor histidine kinase PhoR [Pseudohongiella sp.]MDO9520087.1 phosphate regulon sensor histidine kinase PhoR [Pseudohongiella sp.]MDP2127992.1 phosphate regulon sensor histidine kinase PhoR [Pseudohongiella sp.]
MFSDWHSALKRLALIFLALLLAGWLSGAPALVLLIGTVCYLIYHLLQLGKLYSWLKDNEMSEPVPPPESKGIWGYIFDGIYLLQRREREALLELRSIIDKAQESTAALEIAVIMINSKSGLEWWNPAATRLLGLQNPQDRKQAVTNLIREPVFIEYFNKANFSRPLNLSAPGDSSVMLEFQITSFGEGERLMLVRDVSQLHKLEMMRKDFVGNVSHELRTPITVITGYLETMMDDRNNLPQRWIRPIEQMAQQSRRMENIIKDLLTLSQLETRATSKDQSTIQLLSLLREIKNDAEQVFSEKQHRITLNCAEHIQIKGNLNELYSAVSNLVLNAAKYTPAQGHIALDVIQNNNGLKISVTDDGPGIEPQHIPRLTERFYRVDESRSSDTGGTGLGLAIVKHVLARHGGKLEIRSEPGKGSEFICHFPPERVTPALI